MVSWRTWLVLVVVFAAILFLWYGSPEQYQRGLLTGIGLGSLIQVIIQGLRYIEKQAAKKREWRKKWNAPYEVEPPHPDSP